MPADFTVRVEGNARFEAWFDGRHLPLDGEGQVEIQCGGTGHVVDFSIRGVPGTRIDLSIESSEGYDWRHSAEIPPEGLLVLHHVIRADHDADDAKGESPGGDDWPGPRF